MHTLSVEEDGKQGIMKVFLKYGKINERVITGMENAASKPGLRVYAKQVKFLKY